METTQTASYGIIYKATNKINNKSYIGQTKAGLKARIVSHWRDSKRMKTRFANSLQKHGLDSFIWEIIDFANCQIELDEKEITYIQKYNSTQIEFGYNHCSGGKSSYILSDDSRKKMSDAKKGKPAKNKIDFDDNLLKQIQTDFMNGISLNQLIQKYKRDRGCIIRNLKRDMNFWNQYYESNKAAAKQNSHRPVYKRLSNETCEKVKANYINGVALSKMKEELKVDFQLLKAYILRSDPLFFKNVKRKLKSEPKIILNLP